MLLETQIGSPRALKRWLPFQAMRLGYGLASEPAIACVDPTNQCRLLSARALKTEIGQEFHVTIGDVRKRLRRGARVRCRHVCDAIMRHTSST